MDTHQQLHSCTLTSCHGHIGSTRLSLNLSWTVSPPPSPRLWFHTVFFCSHPPRVCTVLSSGDAATTGACLPPSPGNQAWRKTVHLTCMFFFTRGASKLPRWQTVDPLADSENEKQHSCLWCFCFCFFIYVGSSLNVRRVKHLHLCSWHAIVIQMCAVWGAYTRERKLGVLTALMFPLLSVYYCSLTSDSVLDMLFCWDVSFTSTLRGKQT